MDFEVAPYHMPAEKKTTMTFEIQQMIKNKWTVEIEKYIRSRLQTIMARGKVKNPIGTIDLPFGNTRINFDLQQFSEKFDRMDVKLRTLTRNERFESNVHSARSFVHGFVKRSAQVLTDWRTGVAGVGALALLDRIAQRVIDAKRQGLGSQQMLEEWASQQGRLTHMALQWSESSIRGGVLAATAATGMTALGLGIGAMAVLALVKVAYSKMTYSLSYDDANDHLTKICSDIANDLFNGLTNSRQGEFNFQSQQQMQTLQKQLYSSMIDTNKMYIEAQKKANYEKTLPQVGLLKTIQDQFKNDNVTVFEMCVLAGYSAKEGYISPNAALLYMIGLGLKEDRYYTAGNGELETYLINVKNSVERRYSGMTDDQKQQARKMADVFRKLREKNWSEHALCEIDWDSWGRVSIGSEPGSALSRMHAEVVAVGGMNDFVYGNATEQNCPIMSVTAEEGLISRGLVGKKDMWFETDRNVEPRGDTNFEFAKDVLLRILDSTDWMCRTKEVFNSYQALWLFRWMGPMCSKWIKTETRPVDQPQKRSRSSGFELQFLSDTCRKRYAFLKTILASSLLFPFVRSEDAKKMFNDKSSCVYDTANRLKLNGTDVGRGYCMLLLSECAPGHVKIVGYTPTSNTLLVMQKDVTEFVQLFDNTSQRRWKFNPTLILSNLLATVEKYNMTLISNDCWKATMYGLDRKPESAIKRTLETDHPENGVETINETSLPSHRYNYSKYASVLSLIRTQMASKELAQQIDQSTYLKYYPYETRDYENKIRTYMERTRPVLPDQNGSGNEHFQYKKPVNDADTRFTQVAKDLFSENQIEQLKKCVTETVQDEKYWSELFGDIQARDFIIVNTLCVNPFGLVVYIKDNQVVKIFGDLWFLQPIIAGLDKTSKYKFRRFERIQETCFSDDQKRVYLQDLLYLGAWQSMIGANTQV